MVIQAGGGGRYYVSQNAQSLPTGQRPTRPGSVSASDRHRAAESPPATAEIHSSSREPHGARSTSQSGQLTNAAVAHIDSDLHASVRSRAKSLGAYDAAADVDDDDDDDGRAHDHYPIETERRRLPPGRRQRSTNSDRPLSYPAESIDPVMEAFSIRSPLQELEDKFTTKELKRQKLLDAERRAHQRRLKRRSRNADPAFVNPVESFELPLQALNQRRVSSFEPTHGESLVGPSRSGTDRDLVNGHLHSSPAVNTQHVHREPSAVAAADQFYADPRSDYHRASTHPSPQPRAARLSAAQPQIHSYSAEKPTDVLAIKRQLKRPTYDIQPESPSDDESSLASRSDSQLDLSTPTRKLKHISTRDSPRRPSYFTRLKSAFANRSDPVAIREARRAELGSAYRITTRPSASRHSKSVGPESDDRKHGSGEDEPQDATARFSGILNSVSQDELLEPALPAPPPLQEWRKQSIARLTLDDFALNPAIVGSRPNSKRYGTLDGAADDRPTTFSPPLYLKCGPLLRYTGMRRERRARPGQNTITEREVWRGSIMIVTEDVKSSYQAVPSLRLFAQPPEPRPGDVDPADLLAGRKTTSRTGRTLYIKPADQLPPHEDLSKIENGRGLFDTKRYSDGHCYNTIGRRGIDGEQAGKIRHVNAIRLHEERGLTFWRFQLEVELGTKQARVAYRINNGPAIGFWVPGRNQAMNIMFHSCNGFSMSVDPARFSGPDPLWRDVLNTHERKAYHVMIGGGDQLYNDAVVRDTQLFRDWMNTKAPERKQKTIFSRQMQAELEESYLFRYCSWFSMGLFKVANSQIPMVNMWDDHDIIDGFGSYPHHLMASRVFSGLGAVAFKYYMLFQHQSVVTETYEHEPSWQLGIAPGPYINELSRSLFMFLGRKIALLAVDCRTERMRDEIMTRESYELLLNRCRSEIVKGETKHLLVLLGVPIAYPRLNFLENILTSKAMDPIKALGRTGVLGGFVNKFDGGIEILDNLDDHWTARHHKKERKWFVQELQELAAEKSVRVTILSGDVHLAAVGQFHTSKARGVPKDFDHRYMLNVISSAIVNEPPPDMLADVLNRRSKLHHLDADTEESMCELFTRDVDGQPRNNISLLPHRNYCTITEYQPATTVEPLPTRRERRRSEPEALPEISARRYPPGSMGQSGPPISSFRPRSLLRRMSGSRERDGGGLRPEHIRAYSDSQSGDKPRLSKDWHSGQQSTRDSRYDDGADGDDDSDTESVFYDDNDDDDDDFIEPNFEGGLAITLNVELDQGAVAGTTKPYGVLVPALFYDDSDEHHGRPGRSRRPSIIDRLRHAAVRRSRSRSRSAHGESSHCASDRSDSPSQPEPEPEPKPLLKNAEATFDGTNPREPAAHVRFDGMLGQGKAAVDDRRDSQQTPYMTTALGPGPSPASAPVPKSSNSKGQRGSPPAEISPAIAAPASTSLHHKVDAKAPTPRRPSFADNRLISYILAKREQNRDAILRYERQRAAGNEREGGRGPSGSDSNFRSRPRPRPGPRTGSFSHTVPGLSTRFDEAGRPHRPGGRSDRETEVRTRGGSPSGQSGHRGGIADEGEESATPSEMESAGVIPPADFGGGWRPASTGRVGRR